MGYHVTIVRTKQGRPVPITRAEVEAVLATRPDLEAKANDEGSSSS